MPYRASRGLALRGLAFVLGLATFVTCLPLAAQSYESSPLPIGSATPVETSAPANAPQSSETPEPFAALAQRFVSESERHDPLFADAIGIHTYDDSLDDYSAAGHGRRIAWLRAWRERIAAQSQELTLGDAADARALLDTIDLELFEDAKLAPWRTDPSVYENAIGNAVYALTGRHYAPLDERLRHVAARLPLVPGIVAAAKANLTTPARVATLQAIDANAGNLSLYDDLRGLAKTASPQTRRAIARTLPAALASIRSLGAYLNASVLPRSNGNPRVGAEVYDRELDLANGTAQLRAELVADARTDFQKNRAEMLRLAMPFDRTFFPSRTADEKRGNAADIVVRRVLDRLANDHPTRSEIFRTAKTDVAEAEAFLTAHPVVVLPQPETLRVVPTPEFMAGISGASLDPAGPFTPLAESFYYIDNIPKAWKPARVASYLRDFNNYEMRILSMHEAVPGHYVQLRYNANVPSLVRRVFSNPSLVEGWAVYTEGMMLDAGYAAHDPRLRLFQLKWRLREEANTIIDAAFHTGNLTEAQCRDLLERQAFQGRSEAQTKWHRLELSHVQLTTYFVGLDAIRHAQAAQRRKLGAAFDLAKFNAALLDMGSVEPRFLQTLLDAPGHPN